MSDASDDSTLLCHRCGAILTPGAGNLYVVRIEAMADPFPPTITDDDFTGPASDEIDRLIENMHEHSAQELMDMVHRRLTIHLCGKCYRQWIENPAG